MNSRVFIAVFGAVFASLSHASYELLCVTDQANNVVRRFDGVTGASLGFFGGTGRMSSPTGIALDATTSTAYVSNYSARTIQAWNYSTGVLQSQFQVPSNVSQISTLSSGDLMLTSSTGLHVYTKTGTYVTTLVSGFMECAIEAPDGSIWYGISGGGFNIYRTNYTNGPGSINLGAFLPYKQMTVVGDSIVLGAQTASTYAAFSINWSDFSVIGAGITLGATGVARGHSGNYYLTQGGSIVAGNTAFFGQHSAPFGVVSSAFYANMDSVVAPEPGSMLALSIGVLISARRRRRALS